MLATLLLQLMKSEKPFLSDLKKNSNHLCLSQGFGKKMSISNHSKVKSNLKLLITLKIK